MIELGEWTRHDFDPQSPVHSRSPCRVDIVYFDPKAHTAGRRDGMDPSTVAWSQVIEYRLVYDKPNEVQGVAAMVWNEQKKRPVISGEFDFPSSYGGKWEAKLVGDRVTEFKWKSFW